VRKDRRGQKKLRASSREKIPEEERKRKKERETREVRGRERY